LLPLFVGAQTLSGNERLRVIDGDTIWMPTINDIVGLMNSGGLSSVGLIMPGGFNVANSPLTADGTIFVTNGLSAGFVKSSGVGGPFTSSQYVDLTTDVTGVLPVTNGGTGLDSIGQPGQGLVVNATGTGLEWSNLPSGSGTPNYIPKWLTAGGTLGNSSVYNINDQLGINNTSPNYLIDGEILSGTNGLRLNISGAASRYLTYAGNQLTLSTGSLTYTSNAGLRVMSTANQSPFFLLGTPTSSAGFSYIYNSGSSKELRLGLGSTDPYQFKWFEGNGTGRFFINHTNTPIDRIVGIKTSNINDKGIVMEAPSNHNADFLDYKKGTSSKFRVTPQGIVLAGDSGNATTPEFATVDNLGSGMSISNTGVNIIHQYSTKIRAYSGWVQLPDYPNTRSDYPGGITPNAFLTIKDNQGNIGVYNFSPSRTYSFPITITGTGSASPPFVSARGFNFGIDYYFEGNFTVNCPSAGTHEVTIDLNNPVPGSFYLMDIHVQRTKITLSGTTNYNNPLEVNAEPNGTSSTPPKVRVFGECDGSQAIKYYISGLLLKNG
ncbi:MAG: hypothetical protein D6698_10090, partial [Gammaproteobacteria bacterium]